MANNWGSQIFAQDLLRQVGLDIGSCVFPGLSKALLSGQRGIRFIKWGLPVLLKNEKFQIECLYHCSVCTVYTVYTIVHFTGFTAYKYNWIFSDDNNKLSETDHWQDGKVVDTSYPSFVSLHQSFFLFSN